MVLGVSPVKTEPSDPYTRPTGALSSDRGILGRADPTKSARQPKPPGPQPAARPLGETEQQTSTLSGLLRSLVRMSVSLLGMLSAVLTVGMGRGGMLFGLVVLPMRVMVRRLQMVVRSRVVVARSRQVMLDSRVLVLCHAWSSCE